MNHAEVHRVMADYLEGDLDLSERARFDAHLEDCADCTTEVEEMRQTIRLLQIMPEPEQPPMVAANVMRRIRAGETEPSFLQRMVRGVTGVLEPSFVLPASAVAVAALVTMVVRDPNMLDSFRVDDPTGVAGARVTGASMEGLADDFAGSVAGSFAPNANVASTAASQKPRVGLATVFSRDLLGQGQPSEVRATTEGGSRPVAPGRVGHLASNGLAEARNAPPRPSASELRVGQQRFASDARARAARERFVAGARAARSQAIVMEEGLANVVDRGSSRSGVAWPSAAEAMSPRLAERRYAGTRMDAATVPQGSAMRVAQSVEREGALRFDSSGGDPRDLWLARGLEDPVGLAAFLGSKNLAEQELWVARLTDRAVEQGLLDELVRRLRATQNVAAAVLSDDFLAETTRRRAAQAATLSLGDPGTPAEAPVLSR